MTIRLGIARGITYGLFGPPEQIVAPARDLGAGLLRVYFFWDQVEPAPGKFDWSVVDSLLAQLDGDMEVWVTVCSSSLWATRTPTDFLPPSPANDPEQYHRFVHALVRHCAPHVQYWQCDNEPSNTDLLWAGTAEEYAAQLAVFSRAVRDARSGRGGRPRRVRLRRVVEPAPTARLGSSSTTCCSGRARFLRPASRSTSMTIRGASAVTSRPLGR